MTTETIEKLIEDLSYSFSTPEAQDFMELVKEGRYIKAVNFLVRENGSDKDDAKRIVDHFRKEVEQKFTLVEITLADIDLSDSKQRYIFNYGGSLNPSEIYRYKDEAPTFYHNSQFLPLGLARQIWKVVNN